MRRFFGMELFQSGGTYSSLPSVPKNEIVLFEKDTAVLGYALLTTVDDEIVYISKGSAAGGETGGTDRGSWTLSFSTPNHTHGLGSHTHTTSDHALTIAEMPAHTHTYLRQFPASYPYPGIGSTEGRTIQSGDNTGSTGSGAAHNHGATGAASGSTASGGSETVTISSWRPSGRCFTRQGRL